jgi:hypothetical protein
MHRHSSSSVWSMKTHRESALPCGAPDPSGFSKPSPNSTRSPLIRTSKASLLKATYQDLRDREQAWLDKGERAYASHCGVSRVCVPKLDNGSLG